jgi:recombination protein RecA
VRVKVVKNKLAAPFRDAELDIIFPRGISRAGSLLDVAAAQGIVTRTGTWFAYKDMKLGQGRDNAREFLESNPELAKEIAERTREKVGLTRTAPPADDPAPEVHSNGDARPASRDGHPPVPAKGVPARAPR